MRAFNLFCSLYSTFQIFFYFLLQKIALTVDEQTPPLPEQTTLTIRNMQDQPVSFVLTSYSKVA